MLPPEEEEEGSRRDWPAEDDIQTAWLKGTPESVIRCSYSWVVVTLHLELSIKVSSYPPAALLTIFYL